MTIHGLIARVPYHAQSGHSEQKICCPLCAKTGCEQSKQVALLLGHFVASRKIARRRLS
jgi:hypothetical protein